jgi:hypothetical protein
MRLGPRHGLRPVIIGTLLNCCHSLRRYNQARTRDSADGEPCGQDFPRLPALSSSSRRFLAPRAKRVVHPHPIGRGAPDVRTPFGQRRPECRMVQLPAGDVHLTGRPPRAVSASVLPPMSRSMALSRADVSQLTGGCRGRTPRPLLLHTCRRWRAWRAGEKLSSIRRCSGKASVLPTRTVSHQSATVGGGGGLMRGV